MAYCALADLIKQLPELDIIALTDDENVAPSEIVEATHTDIMSRVNAAIEHADNFIDAHCHKYDTPFTPAPDVIKSSSIVISIYNLLSRRQTDINEVWQERYNDTKELLRNISDGEIVIGTDAQQEDIQAADFIAETREFTTTKLTGF